MQCILVDRPTVDISICVICRKIRSTGSNNCGLFLIMNYIQVKFNRRQSKMLDIREIAKQI